MSLSNSGEEDITIVIFGNTGVYLGDIRQRNQPLKNCQSSEKTRPSGGGFESLRAHYNSKTGSLSPGQLDGGISSHRTSEFRAVKVGSRRSMR